MLGWNDIQMSVCEWLMDEKSQFMGIIMVDMGLWTCDMGDYIGWYGSVNVMGWFLELLSLYVLIILVCLSQQITKFIL